MQYNRKCPICGKLFYVGSCDYVYKMNKYVWDRKLKKSEYTERIYLCSWTCYRKAERIRENEIEAGKESKRGYRI